MNLWKIENHKEFVICTKNESKIYNPIHKDFNCDHSFSISLIKNYIENKMDHHAICPICQSNINMEKN